MTTVDPRTCKSALAWLLLTTALTASGCNRPTPNAQGNGAQPAAVQTGAAAPADPCSGAINQGSKLPGGPGNSQLTVDCSAWQAFIALNWKGDASKPGFPDPSATWASFGTPGDQSPTVWETYLEASAVFNGPPLKGLWQRKRPAVKSLVRTSKFGNIDLRDIVQAGSGDHWLTNQRGDITYYEVMMNQDEYEFITQQGFDLTTAAGQLACATQPGKLIFDGPPPPPPLPPGPLRGGMNMPAGMQPGWNDSDCAGNKTAFGQNVGAIEIKAAWTPLPADHSLDYRYKTAQAEIKDPVTGKSRLVTVGLVGLHIARKRFPKLPWVWATFEQIDNAPDEGPNGGFSKPAFPPNANQRPSPGYTFFNPSCDPKKDPTYGCQHNRPPRPCGTSGLVCDPYDKPMQITRLNPVGNPANQVTAYVWSLLPAKSVFNYYRLIDVQWPQAPLGTPPGPGLRTPLTMGNPMPAGASGGVTQIVANTTLESFQQNKASCFDCHANFASIAQPPGRSATGPNGLRKVASPTQGQKPYASDYSFIFLSETKK